MKNLNNYILEKSINAKKRDLKSLVKSMRSGHKYSNILSVGIITAENPDSKEATSQENKKYMKELSDLLKTSKRAFTRVGGQFAGNTENTYAVFNVSTDELSYYAGKFQQTSFIFCIFDGDKVISEYWEKENKKLPYNKKTNNYVKKGSEDTLIETPDADDNFTFIGKKFKYNIPFDPKLFEAVNNKFADNCERYNMTVENGIDVVGFSGNMLRAQLNEGLADFTI